MLARIRQRIVSHQRSDEAQLRGIRLEKFSACRDGIKKIRDADSRSRRQSRRLYADQFSASELDARAFGFRLVPRFEQQPRYGSDGWQRFPAKAERGNGQQIV